MSRQEENIVFGMPSVCMDKGVPSCILDLTDVIHVASSTAYPIQIGDR